MSTRIDVKADVAGRVWQIECAVGTQLNENETILVLESMKMEIPIPAPKAGTVAALPFKEGDTVEEGDTVAVLDTDD